jgi:hypothetical protein
MKLMCLTLPDQVDQLAAWLEGQLVGLHLAELAAELRAVHGDAAGPPLAEILRGREPQVLTEGLRGLSRRRLRLLLQHPDRLLELQTLVLAEGGPYWNVVAAEDAELNDLFRRGEQQLVDSAVVPRPEPVPIPWYRWPAVVSLATAAAVLLAVWLGLPYLVPKPILPGPPSVGWGWAKTEPPQGEVNAAAYLNRLADGAQEWFKRRPEDRMALARRILEFRQGCSTLIVGEHPPLADRDREWLVQQCRDWAKQFDEQLRTLEGGADVLAVRHAMDKVAEEIVQALRERALRQGAA